MDEVRQFTCRDCKRVIGENDRLGITVRLPNKPYLQDPENKAGFTERMVYKCPYCRGRLA